MTALQGDLALLQDPVAQRLLESTEPARIAYNWSDGTPRVVPMWFTWTGEELVCGTPPGAPKVKVLADGAAVAATIDDASRYPWKALLLRGNATVQLLDDVASEYVQAAHRYLGPEQGEVWLTRMRGYPSARIAIRPTWAAVLDFETRFPSALRA